MASNCIVAAWIYERWRRYTVYSYGLEREECCPAARYTPATATSISLPWTYLIVSSTRNTPLSDTNHRTFVARIIVLSVPRRHFHDPGSLSEWTFDLITLPCNKTRSAGHSARTDRRTVKLKLTYCIHIFFRYARTYSGWRSDCEIATGV